MTLPTDPAEGRPPKPRLLRGKWLLYPLAGLFVASCCVLLPCTQKIRDGEGWTRSVHSLRMIGQAMLAYHEQAGRLPPAVVTDKQGKPLYSWRVLLLPYLDQSGLYERFHLNEPWDSPHNKQFLDKTPRSYRPAGGSDDPLGLTRYQVLVGPGTAFERDGLTLADFPDGLSETLLIVEGGEAVPWSKPAELTYDPNGPLPPLGGAFGKPVHVLCYEVARRPGFAACFADGETRFLSGRNDEQTIRGLITRNGHESIDLSKME